MINLLLRDGQKLTNNNRYPASRQSLVPPSMNNAPNSENSRLGDDLPSFSVGIRYLKRKINSDCPSDILTNSNRDENNTAEFQNPTLISWSRNNSISINSRECSKPKSPTEEIWSIPLKRKKVSFLKIMKNPNKLYSHDEHRSKTPNHRRSKYINSDIDDIRMKTPEFFKKALAKISPSTSTRYQDSKWIVDVKGASKKNSICSAKFMSCL